MRLAHLTLALGVLALTLGPAQAEPRQLKLIMFHGIGGLPVYVAQDKGFFAKYGLAADVTYTPTSDFQRKSLAEGKFDIAPTGADNAVYMDDTGVADVILVAGGDNSMNELLVRPGLGSYDDIRGKAVVVDAPNTAFAFQLYKMLELKGIKHGEYAVVSKGGTPQRLAAMKEDPNNAAAMIGTPFNIAAEKEGFRSLGNVTEVLGPYQGGAVAVLRSWAKANSATLIRFLKAEIAAQRWAFDPKNRAELGEILGKREKLDPETIRAGIEAAVGGSKPGLDREMRFDLIGFREVLRLRAEFAGNPGAKPPSPNKYLDLSYYRKALEGH